MDHSADARTFSADCTLAARANWANSSPAQRMFTQIAGLNANLDIQFNAPPAPKQIISLLR
jgi:hypothetical protein